MCVNVNESKVLQTVKGENNSLKGGQNPTSPPRGVPWVDLPQKRRNGGTPAL